MVFKTYNYLDAKMWIYRDFPLSHGCLNFDISRLFKK